MKPQRRFQSLSNSFKYVFLGGLIGFLSCDPIGPSGDCWSFSQQPTCHNTQLDMILDTISFEEPCFNPNNPNEFVFEGHNNKVFKYNMITQQYTLLFNGPTWSTPNWSRTGWIVLSSGGEIVKFKDDGTSLTYLTSGTTEGGYWPNWNYDGSKILYHSTNGLPNFVILMTSNGVKLDTVPLFPNSLGWTYNIMYGSAALPDSTMVWAPGFDPFVGFQHLQELNLTPLYNYTFPADASISETIDDMDYIPGSNDVLWMTEKGIHRTNLVTNNTTSILVSCESKVYRNFSVSPDGTKILVEVLQYKKIDKCTYSYSIHIHQINIDGTGEVDLNLPSY